MCTKRLHRIVHKLLFFASTCVGVLVGFSCADNDDAMHIASSGQAIAFSTTPTSRAAVVVDSTLTEIGLFGYYTTQLWSAAESAALPDYFYNTKLARSSSASSWSYSPLKYWPNEGYISFFGYSPYTDEADGNSTLVLSSPNQAGSPSLSYTIQNSVAEQVDLLWATPVYDQSKSTSPRLLITEP